MADLHSGLQKEYWRIELPDKENQNGIATKAA